MNYNSISKGTDI